MMPLKFKIDAPAMFPGYRLVTENASLEISGWAFGDHPTYTVAVRLDGVPYPVRGEVGTSRPGVAKAFPDVEHAGNSGFRLPITLPDNDDHNLVIRFTSGDDVVDLPISIHRAALPGIPYVHPNTVAMLYNDLVGRTVSPAMLQLIMRQGTAQMYNREDYIHMICGAPEFRALLRNSDVFSRFVDVQFKDCLFRLPEHDHITGQIAASGKYEPHVIDYLLESLSKGSVFVDIGANVGLFAIPAAKIVGSTGKVYAIEALGRNAKIIAVNAELNGLDNIHLIPLGAAEKVGANFWFRQDSGSNNVITDVPLLKDRPFEDFDLIGVVPLDVLIPKSEKVAVIKIDIEGREYKALQGAMRIIQTSRPLVFCEYSPASQLRRSGVEGQSLLRLFLDLEYDVEILIRGRPRELVRGNAAAKIERIDNSWKQYNRDKSGTHLDLCFTPA